MAQAKFINIMTTCEGLNNAVDPVRVKYSLRDGTTELTQAVNVDIDRTGRITRRLGRSLKNATAAAYGYAYGETCLFVGGQTLYKMRQNYSIAALRTDLTENARMRYYGIADRIYYTNEFEKGYVQKGQNFAWEKGNYTSPGNIRRTFSDPPKCHLLGWFSSRMLAAAHNVVYASEPSFYGVFDLFGNTRIFPNKVTMLQSTPQGLWVGTSNQVLFFSGQKWKELKRVVKADYGVLEGSDAWCSGEKRGGQRAIIFTTPQGICAGGEDGSFTNLSYNKLTFPSGRYASAAVTGDRYIVLIEP